MSKENRLAMQMLVSPPLDVVLENPMDYMLYHPKIAFKIGIKAATLMGTMLAISSKHELTNQLVWENFSGLYGPKTIDSCLKKLENLNLITACFMTPEEIADLLKEKKLHGKGIGNCPCAWCGYSALSLDAHHFPEHRKNGGENTVNICQNCHKEYHYLAGQAGRPSLFYYQVNESKYEELLELDKCTP